MPAGSATAGDDARYPLASVDHALRIIEMLRPAGDAALRHRPRARGRQLDGAPAAGNARPPRVHRAAAGRAPLSRRPATARHRPQLLLVAAGRARSTAARGAARRPARRSTSPFARPRRCVLPRCCRVAACHARRRGPAAGCRRTGSTGKVLLADLDDDTVRRLYDGDDWSVARPTRSPRSTPCSTSWPPAGAALCVEPRRAGRTSWRSPSPCAVRPVRRSPASAAPRQPPPRRGRRRRRRQRMG